MVFIVSSWCLVDELKLLKRGYTRNAGLRGEEINTFQKIPRCLIKKGCTYVFLQSVKACSNEFVRVIDANRVSKRIVRRGTMVFSSVTFLFLVLPVVLLFIFPLSRGLQNTALLGISFLFYLWGAGWQIVWIFSVALVSYFAARVINKNNFTTSKSFFVVMITITLSPLLSIKYLPPVSAWFGLESIMSIAIPLGISFFTFHAVSYLIDVKRGTILAEKRLDHYLLYLFYFPHQIAGPIVRYSEIRDDIKLRPRPQTSDVVVGFSRFGWGLSKKVFVADPAGMIATTIWASAQNGENLSIYAAWLGAIAFAIQIYFDFSAYSDMAIGLARIFNFHFPENFKSPYLSHSATDFWRRWHLTLSRWFRDYVYIPLGGNRYGVGREYFALIVTFALTSIWHGATFPYLLWGGMWSLMLIIERVTGLKESLKFIRIRRFLFLIFIIVSWVPFRSPDWAVTSNIWESMVSGPALPPQPNVLVLLTPLTVMALFLGVMYMLRPRLGGYSFFEISTGMKVGAEPRVLRTALVGVVAFALGLILTIMSTSSPFLYFQF